MTEKVILKTGEAKLIDFTVKDAEGVAVNLSGATLTLGVKKNKADTAFAFAKADSDFNKGQVASGIVSVNLTTSDTDLNEGTYVGELKMSWDGPPAVVEKTADFYFQIRAAVIQG